MRRAEIGIIGGSGLYSMPGLTEIEEAALQTPFGAPSDAYVTGVLEGRKVAFLARRGRGAARGASNYFALRRGLAQGRA